MNEGPQRQWLKNDQQLLKKKGNGRAIHICGWICETTGHLKLSDDQIVAQSTLTESQRLKVTDSQKIIYPGKNHYGWWDLVQLMDQIQHAIDIFKFLHPDKVRIWLFDCSSAHEDLAEDALNVNNMNVNPGGKQWHLHTTTIPTNNPPPKPGCPDTQGQLQEMVYTADHSDPKLQGQPKGMKAVLQGQKSVWDELMSRCKGKVVGKCKECLKSQAKKDAERWVAEAEVMGQEDLLAEDNITQAHAPESSEPVSNWCCMHRVLSLQDDFANEKPMLQHYVEGRRHICMFLPKFHCELNPIERLWGYAKYRKSFTFLFALILMITFKGYRNVSDGKFTTAKQIVPQCLDMCDTTTIRCFFQKSWRYMDAYLCISHFHLCGVILMYHEMQQGPWLSPDSLFC